MKKLEHKVAIVTGGNSGLGLAAAALFAKQGAQVVITGRNPTTLEKAVSHIGHGAKGIVSDVSQLENISALYEEVQASFGKIDVLVLNAGILNAGALNEYSEEDFDTLIDINFKGVYFSVQKALPFLNDGASIILTGSAVGDKGFTYISAYAATKAAVRSMARSFSAELADRHIRVNVISPGPIDTPIFGRSGASDAEVAEMKSKYAGITHVKRLGTVEEIAEGFLYLASDDSRFMLGGELLLDGGIATL